MDSLIIPLGIGVRGDISLELINVKTGVVEDARHIRNTLLNGYLNSFFSGEPLLSSSRYQGTCAIGTSSQPPARTDTGLVGTTLASVPQSSSSASSAGIYPVTYTANFVFPAGTGTGTVAEVGLRGTYYYCARQIIVPAIEKTASHELRITWTITVSRGADSWSGTIAAGQRDGVTDINWVATIHNFGLYDLALRSPFGSVSARTGTSNAPSILASDSGGTIKGTELFLGSPSLSSVLVYTTGTFYRDVRLGFEIGQSNGAIGELCHASGYWYSRITFTPALDKINTYRLYVTLRYSLVNPS